MPVELVTVPTETTIDPAADLFYFNDVSEAPDAINKAVLNNIIGTPTMTFTNKRITPRVVSITSSATPTPNADTTDEFHITGFNGGTFAVPSGTPTDGQVLAVRMLESGAATPLGSVLGWNAVYRFLSVTTPKYVESGAVMRVWFVYNAAATKWDCIAVQTDNPLVIDIDANTSVLAGQSGTTFTNAGAAGAITATLPTNANCEIGKTEFEFVQLAAFQIHVKPASGNIYWVDESGTNYAATNGSPANSAALIGESFKVKYIATNVWRAVVQGKWSV